MPLADYEVLDYKTYPGKFANHVWRVAEPLAITDPQMRWCEVAFEEQREAFGCAIHGLVTCDHIIAVAKFIINKSGPWESDVALMESAWGIAGATRSKTNYQVERIQEIGYSGSPGVGNFVVTQDRGGNAYKTRVQKEDGEYLCSCGIGKSARTCGHIEAVRSFEGKEEQRLSSPWISWVGLDPKKTDDISNQVKRSIKKAIEDQVKQAYTRGPDWSLYTWPSADGPVILDKLHQDPPEKPKKPKSRFSEIDL